MLPFQKTTVYRNMISTADFIMRFFDEKDISIRKKIEEEILNSITNIAKALSKADSSDNNSEEVSNAVKNLYGILAILDVALGSKLITADEKSNLDEKLHKTLNAILNFDKNRKKILILSAEMGQGHMSASKAIKEGIEYKYGYDYKVEIIDFVELLNSFMNLFAKKNYENLVKFAPSIYKFIYESSNKQVQIVKLLNQINYPFVLTKLKKYFEEKQPDLLISTFPVWNYLAAEIWKKYRKDAKFVTIVTDSISIHHSWAIADTDYHIVANKDTAHSLMKYGVDEEKIKILGFPVRLKFNEKANREEILGEMNLDPKKFTILFLPTSQNQKKNQKIMKDLNKFDSDMNVIIVTGRDIKLKPKFDKLKLKDNMRVLGWTDKMCELMKASDVVVTKAGGATIMECIAAGKPMIITSVIPGQEQGNAELIKKYHLGIVADRKNSNIAEDLDYMKSKYPYFKNNLDKISNPESSIKIAEFIHELLN